MSTEAAHKIVQTLVDQGKILDDPDTIALAIEDVKRIARQRVRFVVTRVIRRFV